MESMTWDISDPRMHYTHRLGVAALARTCQAMQDEEELSPDNWEVSEQTLTLKGDVPTLLRSIYDYGFQIRNDVLFMPGSYESGSELPKHIRCEIQQNLLASILVPNYDVDYLKEKQSTKGQKTNSEKSSKNKNTKVEKIVSFICEDKTITVKHSVVELFKRHNANRVKDFYYAKSKKQNELIPHLEVKMQNMIGAMTTHAFDKEKYTINMETHLVIALDFILAGVLPIKWKKKNKEGQDEYFITVIYPEVTNLIEYIENRAALNPVKYSDTIARESTDAAVHIALQFMTAAKAAQTPKFILTTLGSVAWNGNQKVITKKQYLDFTEIDGKIQRRLKRVHDLFKPCVRTSEKNENYFSLTEFRAFFTNNIINNVPWFTNISELIGNYEKQFKYISTQDKEGFLEMANYEPNLEVEMALVDAIHHAMKVSKAKIRNVESDGQEMTENNWTAVNKKFNKDVEVWVNEMNRFRRVEDIRQFLARTFSTNFFNTILSEHVRAVMNLFHTADSDYIRDIVLLAFASYSNKKTLG